MAVALSFFLNGVLVATWVSRIPAVQSRLGLTHGTLGLALLCLAFGAVLAMPVSGWLASRYGSHRITQFAALLCCTFLPLLALAPTAQILMLALFAFGAVHGGFDVAMNAQAVAVEERYRRPIMSSFHALWSLGGLVGAAIGSGIAAVGIHPFAHFSIAGLLFGGIACAVALPRLLHVSRTILPAAIEDKRTAAPFGLRSAKLIALGAIAFCVMMGEGAMADWSAIFLRDSAGSPESLAAMGYAAFSIAMAIGRVYGDRLTERLGGTVLLRLSGIVAMVGLGAALVFPHPAVALAGFAAVGLGFATVVPVVFSAAGRTSAENPGGALAAVTTVGYFGFLVGPPTIGFIAECIGLRLALGVVVITSFCIVALAHHVRLRPQRHRGRETVLHPWSVVPTIP